MTYALDVISLICFLLQFCRILRSQRHVIGWKGNGPVHNKSSSYMSALKSLLCVSFVQALCKSQLIWSVLCSLNVYKAMAKLQNELMEKFWTLSQVSPTVACPFIWLPNFIWLQNFPMFKSQQMFRRGRNNKNKTTFRCLEECNSQQKQQQQNNNRVVGVYPKWLQNCIVKWLQYCGGGGGYQDRQNLLCTIWAYQTY